MPAPGPRKRAGRGRRMGGFLRLNSAMKRRILVCLLAALLLVLGAAAAASAETASLKFAMELSDSKFTGPKEITISIKITNAGEADMPGPVTLYDPSGKQVEEFGAPCWPPARRRPGPASGT